MEDLNEIIKRHLLQNKEFLNSIKEEFQEEQLGQIISHLKGKEVTNTEYIDDFYVWFEYEMKEADSEILSISWDSDGWGPGGNGCIRYLSRFGLVRMVSSDYGDDDELEIFEMDSFFPWGVDDGFNTDYLMLDSCIYSTEELLAMSKNLSIGERTRLSINGFDIE
jgi:hypothetical protein